MTITMILKLFSSKVRVNSEEIAERKRVVQELTVDMENDQKERRAATSGLHNAVDAQGVSICKLQEYMRKKNGNGRIGCNGKTD